MQETEQSFNNLDNKASDISFVISIILSSYFWLKSSKIRTSTSSCICFVPKKKIIKKKWDWKIKKLRDAGEKKYEKKTSKKRERQFWRNKLEKEILKIVNTFA